MATTSIGPPSTSAGSPKRWIASTSTYTATPSSSTALARAARISRRYQPNVRCERAEPRPARWMAASAMPMPMTSVSMCPASDSRASEPVTNAADDLDDHEHEQHEEGGEQRALVARPADSDTCECEWPFLTRRARAPPPSSRMPAPRIGPDRWSHGCDQDPDRDWRLSWRTRRRARRRRSSARWNVISSRTASGTSSRSASLRFGRTTSVRPARWAARTFCLRPPIGSTAPCSVISPVMPTVGLTGWSRSRLTSAVVIVMPADGPSLGTAPAGTWTWNRRRTASGSTPSSAACERT